MVPAPKPQEYAIPRYPNGWFRVLMSDELARGAVKPIRYFGRDLAVFRGEDGQARVVDAHCPHLGAHLGYGGKVRENTVVCPFHGWRFDGEGVCVEAPFAKKIPARARLNCWPVREVNGMIWVHFHDKGLEPDYEIPELPEFLSTKFSRGWAARRIATHIQETQDNMVDLVHFCFIHKGVLQVPQVSEWVEEQSHLRVTLDSVTSLGPFTAPTRFTFDVYGVGCQFVHVDAKVKFVIAITITPVDEQTIDLRAFVLFPKSAVPFVGWLGRVAMLKRVMAEIGEDVPLWENKIRPAHPALYEHDAPMVKLRRWNERFYSMPEKTRASGA